MEARLTGIAQSIGRSLHWVLRWWWRKTRSSWIEAWREPDRELRILYLVTGAAGFWFVGQHAFGASFWTGLSFAFASFLAISSATVFLVRGVPLGFAAPFLIFIGVLLSNALRSVMLKGVVEAIAGNLLAGAIMIGAMVFLEPVASRLKRVELPEESGRKHEDSLTRMP